MYIPVHNLRVRIAYKWWGKCSHSTQNYLYTTLGQVRSCIGTCMHAYTCHSFRVGLRVTKAVRPKYKWWKKCRYGVHKFLHTTLGQVRMLIGTWEPIDNLYTTLGQVWWGVAQVGTMYMGSWMHVLTSYVHMSIWVQECTSTHMGWCTSLLGSQCFLDPGTLSSLYRSWAGPNMCRQIIYSLELIPGHQNRNQTLGRVENAEIQPKWRKSGGISRFSRQLAIQKIRKYAR